MTDAIKLGLIGCGGQGGYLSEAAAVSGRAELVACADIDAGRAEQFATEFGYSDFFGNAAEMLDETDVEAVIIATSHDQLQPAALDAVRAGRHALVEKPMALSAQAGHELVEAAREADVRLMCGYTLRFLPERLEMRRLLEEGAVGEVTHVTAGQLIGAMGGWLADRNRGGGPLYYVGSHALDFLLWMAGAPVESVYADVNRADDGSVETDASVAIRFANGILGQLLTSRRMGGRYGWCDVIGSAGRLRAEWESDEVFVQSEALPQFANPTHIRVPQDAHHPRHPREASARLSGFKYVRSWAAEFAEFADAIQEGREPSVSGGDAVRVLEVMDAIFESGRTGARVQL
ncbi:MAG: Gfo/Idh/MocA family protein [Armatimonadota bacterium]|jgi:UDP-N-acetyl-2-amino-2-deoxyglucuronate dehydrogenase